MADPGARLQRCSSQVRSVSDAAPQLDLSSPPVLVGEPHPPSKRAPKSNTYSHLPAVAPCADGARQRPWPRAARRAHDFKASSSGP